MTPAGETTTAVVTQADSSVDNASLAVPDGCYAQDTPRVSQGYRREGSCAHTRPGQSQHRWRERVAGAADRDQRRKKGWSHHRDQPFFLVGGGRLA